MELNISTCYKIFEKHYDRIFESFHVTPSNRSTLENIVACRALILFKLDLTLIEHRNSIDPDRFILFGKNALYSYLFTKKGVPYAEAKAMNLQDTLVILAEDISSYLPPAEIFNLLARDFNFSLNSIQDVNDDMRAFKDSDWDFGPADTRLN
ncbi:TPA: hypothetical protein ACF6GX_005220 [Raoultella ornithinolytica]